jgi:YebC/PmpR family DNA-binding regulatory protein
MSGHSHAKTVMHTKQVADKKRGKIFSKLSRLISVAAKKGGDPDINPELRIAIGQAKKANMPQANVERAIKKGTGELEGETLEEFCFEAYGPAKSALVITGITSNKNRALSEIKQILNQNNAKLAEEGSVKWQFEEKGIILVSCTAEEDKEKLEMAAIEAGAEDIRQQKNLLEIYTKPDSLENVKRGLESSGVVVESAILGWTAKEEIELDEKNKTTVEKLLEALDDNDDVQEVYSNMKL